MALCSVVLKSDHDLRRTIWGFYLFKKNKPLQASLTVWGCKASMLFNDAKFDTSVSRVNKLQ